MKGLIIGLIVRLSVKLIVYKIITTIIYRYCEEKFSQMAETQYA